MAQVYFNLYILLKIGTATIFYFDIPTTSPTKNKVLSGTKVLIPLIFLWNSRSKSLYRLPL